MNVMRKVMTLCGIIDSEYEVLDKIMEKEDVITHLMEGYEATREEATMAVELMGCWEE